MGAVVDLRTTIGGAVWPGRGKALRCRATTSVPKATSSSSNRLPRRILSRVRTESRMTSRNYQYPYEAGMNPTNNLVAG